MVLVLFNNNRRSLQCECVYVCVCGWGDFRLLSLPIRPELNYLCRYAEGRKCHLTSDSTLDVSLSSAAASAGGSSGVLQSLAALNHAWPWALTVVMGTSTVLIWCWLFFWFGVGHSFDLVLVILFIWCWCWLFFWFLFSIDSIGAKRRYLFVLVLVSSWKQ